MARYEFRSYALCILIFAGVFLASCVSEEATPSAVPSPTTIPSPTPSPTPSPVDDVLEGDERFQASDLNGALKAYQQALAIDAEYSPAHTGLSRVYYWQSKYEEAILHATRAIDADPDAVDPYLNLSRAQFVTYQIEEAIKSAKEAVALEPENGRAQAVLSTAYLYDHQFEKAREAIEKAYSIDPGSPMVNHALGRYLEETADYHRARVAYQRAVEAEPGFFGWYLHLGHLYYYQDQLDLALETYEKARDLAPDQLSPLLGLAKIKIYQRDFEEAHRYLDKAVELDLEDDDLHETRSTLLVTQEEYDAAIDELNLVLKTSPEDFQALLGIAHIHVRQGDCDQAKTKLSDLAAGHRRSFQIVFAQGAAEICAGNPEKALTYFREAADLVPYAYKAQLGMGNAYVYQNRWEDAQERYLEALQLSPSPADVHDELGVMMYYQGMVDEAEKEFQIVLDHSPYHLETYTMMAEIFFIEEQYEKALDLAERAVEIDPGHQDSLLVLAIAHYFNGNSENTVGILEDIVEDESSDPVGHLYLGLAYRDLGKYRLAKDEVNVYRELRKNELSEGENQRLELLVNFLDIGYTVSETKALADLKEYVSLLLDPALELEIRDIEGEGRTLVLTMPVSASDLESGNAYYSMYLAASISSFIGPRIDPPIKNGLMIDITVQGRTQLTAKYSLEDMKKFGDTLITEEEFVLKLDLSSPDSAYQTTPFWEIKQRVAKLRELESQAPVSYQMVDSEEFGELWDSSLDGRQRSLMQNTDELLTMLGLIPPEMNLETTMQDMYSEQVAGYYLPGKDTLYIVKQEEDSFDDEITIAHEYVHALQDQVFDLEELDGRDLNDDQSLAKDALLEGDATLASILYRSENISVEDEIEAATEQLEIKRDTFEEMPYYIQKVTEFPYLAGMKFVSALHQRGGWEEVNQAYQMLPQSTEQILHPHDYWEGDQPVDVKLTEKEGVLESEWQLVDTNVMGELGLKLVLAEHIGPAAGGEGAEGWGGDTYLLFHNPEIDQHVWILKTYWDDGEEADEFWGLFQGCMDHRAEYEPVIETLIGEFASRVWKNNDHVVYMEQEDQNVIVIFGPDQELVKRLAAEYQE